MSPYTLGFLSLALLILGIWQNYKMFPYEYKSSMFLSVLKSHASFIIIIAVILGGMITTMMIYGKNAPSIATVVPEIIPAAIMNTNKNKNIIEQVPLLNNAIKGNLGQLNATKGNLGQPNATKGNNSNSRGDVIPNNSRNKTNNNTASTSFKVV